MVYRNPKLLKLANGAPCQLCGIQNDTVVSAHSNSLADGKGKGIKAHDYRIAFLCHKCHYELDQGSKMSKEQRREMWEYSHRKTIGYLFENDLIEVK